MVPHRLHREGNRSPVGDGAVAMAFVEAEIQMLEDR